MSVRSILGAVVAGALAAAVAASPAAADTSSCPAAINGLGGGPVYYVSPSGSDSNTGSSPCSPWQTMAKVDGAGLKPGDTVAFEGGQTFSASLSPWGGLAGSASQPIFYTSYGNGQATLAGGIYLNSVSYLTFDNLSVTNSNGPGIGTGGSGSGATNITVRNDTISSSYSGGVGGYGIALRNSLDSGWTIQNDTISGTSDSGIFSKGGATTIDHNVLASNGVGSYCGTGSGQNPCHGIYAKGPNAVVTNNTISNPQTVGVSLRTENGIVEGNTISGGQKGIAFNSETTTPGRTYILGNTIYGQSDTGIQLYSGTQPLYESFVIASNTVYNAANYALYVVSGPNSGTSQTVTVANNLFQATPSNRAYLSLAYPNSYTKSTYLEHYDSFYGASSSTPYYVAGSALSWNGYKNSLGSGSEGKNDMTKDPLLNSSTFALGSGSPAIGSGTLAVPGITYSHVASCPSSGSTALLQWQYCGSASAPDMGSS